MVGLSSECLSFTTVVAFGTLIGVLVDFEFISREDD
jgi:hypothetical protein